MIKVICPECNRLLGAKKPVGEEPSGIAYALCADCGFTHFDKMYDEDCEISEMIEDNR